MVERAYVRRVVSLVVDAAAFLGAWFACVVVVFTLLAGRAPDNPWGVLAFAVSAGFPLAVLTLASLEVATGATLGRALVGLQLHAAGSPDELRRARLWARAGVKAAAIVVLGWQAVSLSDRHAGALWVMLIPFAAYAAVNAWVCFAREDGRGLLDLVGRSRSSLGKPRPVER